MAVAAADSRDRDRLPAAAGAKVIGYDVLFAERDIRKFMVGRHRVDRR